ncbi:MAG: hypothetical protein K2J10_05665 [Muribaculaceae bacterium]|nr:hypothetical protein [Muribaculaceae bacterium]
MKTVSQTFDFSRFGHCLKRDLTLNGRGWLLRLLLMIAVTTLLLYIATKPIIDFDFGFMPDYDDIQINGSYKVFCFCGFIFCMLGASLFMENMTTPGSRLNSLMSPASQVEKYISRMLICVVGVVVAFIASFALAELFRFLIIKAFFGDVAGLRYISVLEVQNQSEHWYYLWELLLVTQATYVLGSTIAPKNSFLKTSGALILLNILLITAMTSVYNISLTPGCLWPAKDAQELIINTFKFAPACWTVFCYITAYYRMKESEIIERL